MQLTHGAPPMVVALLAGLPQLVVRPRMEVRPRTAARRPTEVRHLMEVVAHPVLSTTDPEPNMEALGMMDQGLHTVLQVVALLVGLWMEGKHPQHHTRSMHLHLQLTGPHLNIRHHIAHQTMMKGTSEWTGQRYLNHWGLALIDAFFTSDALQGVGLGL